MLATCHFMVAKIESRLVQKICDVKGLSDAKVDKILTAANALAPIAGWTNALTLTHQVSQLSICHPSG
jgi:hypothetical protein